MSEMFDGETMKPPKFTRMRHGDIYAPINSTLEIYLASEVDAYLEKLFASAVPVVCRQVTEPHATSWKANEPSTRLIDPPTHLGFLIISEPIASESADDLLAELVAVPGKIGMGSMYNCEVQDIIERARAYLSRKGDKP